MALEDELEAIAGARHVLRDPDLRAPYETDWTRRFSGTARCVVRPGSTAEVAAVVQTCAEHGAPVVPQGGNTGLAGASVPRGGEVVLSLARLDAVGAVDPALAQVEAGAGATLGALQAQAGEAGLDPGLDFAARDAATVGGIVACDAGGARALRHGTARARVAGLEAVLGDGQVVSRMSGLLKDNAGYDLGALLVGSEGTLGVITRVRWRLVARLPARVAALVPLASVTEAAALLAALRRELPTLEAADFFLHAGLELVLAHLRLPSPVREPAPVYVLLECADRDDPTEGLAEVLGDRDALVATDTGERERLWRLRESHTEAISARGVPHKLDVGVPLPALGEFLERVPGAVAGACPGAETILFGHLGDGNVHVNVLGPPADDPRADDVVLALVVELGGTISAEHGVGTAKAGWLERARGHEEVAAMRAVKGALDPCGILNPGAVLASPAAPVSAAADYPHRTLVPTRWKDNDVYGHVNNVEYYSYFDTVINAWLITEGGLDIHAGGVIGVCAESHCEYRGALEFPESVEARLRVGRLGRTSVRYELALHRPHAEEPAALGWFVHVFVDRETHRPVEIPPPLRGALERLVP